MLKASGGKEGFWWRDLVVSLSPWHHLELGSLANPGRGKGFMEALLIQVLRLPPKKK